MGRAGAKSPKYFWHHKVMSCYSAHMQENFQNNLPKPNVTSEQLRVRRLCAIATTQFYEIRGALDGLDWVLGYTNLEDGGTPLKVAQQKYPDKEFWVVDLRKMDLKPKIKT